MIKLMISCQLGYFCLIPVSPVSVCRALYVYLLPVSLRLCFCCLPMFFHFPVFLSPLLVRLLTLPCVSVFLV